MPSYRTGRNRSVRSQREFAAGDALNAGLRGEDQDDVGGLRARLKAPAAAGQGKEYRITPCRGQLVAHRQHTIAVAPAENERDLGDIGNHCNAVGMCEQRIRQTHVRHGSEFFKHFGGGEQASFFARTGLCNIYKRGREYRDQ